MSKSKYERSPAAVILDRRLLTNLMKRADRFESIPLFKTMAIGYLDRGSNPYDIADNATESPYAIATRLGHEEMIAIMKEKFPEGLSTEELKIKEGTFPRDAAEKDNSRTLIPERFAKFEDRLQQKQATQRIRDANNKELVRVAGLSQGEIGDDFDRVFELLGRDGIDPYLPDPETGKSAFDVAKENGSIEFMIVMEDMYPNAAARKAIEKAKETLENISMEVEELRTRAVDRTRAEERERTGASSLLLKDKSHNQEVDMLANDSAMRRFSQRRNLEALKAKIPLEVWNKVISSMAEDRINEASLLATKAIESLNRPAPLMLKNEPENPGNKALDEQLARIIVDPSRDIDKVNELLQRGADPELAFYVARNAGKVELVQTIVAHTMSQDPPSKWFTQITDQIEGLQSVISEMEDLNLHLRVKEERRLERLPETAAKKAAAKANSRVLDPEMLAQFESKQVTQLMRDADNKELARVAALPEEELKNNLVQIIALFKRGAIDPYLPDPETDKSAFDVAKENGNIEFMYDMEAFSPNEAARKVIERAEKSANLKNNPDKIFEGGDLVTPFEASDREVKDRVSQDFAYHEAQAKMQRQLQKDLSQAMLASDYGQVKVLLEGGADPYKANSITKKSAFDIAKENKSLSLMHLVNIHSSSDIAKQAIHELKQEEAIKFLRLYGKLAKNMAILNEVEEAGLSEAQKAARANKKLEQERLREEVAVKVKKETEGMSADQIEARIKELELKLAEGLANEAKTAEGKASNARSQASVLVAAAPLAKEEVARIREKMRDVEKRKEVSRANQKAATVVSSKPKKPVMSDKEREKMNALAERDRLKEAEKVRVDKLARDAKLSEIEVRKQARLKGIEKSNADKLEREAKLAEAKKQAKLREEEKARADKLERDARLAESRRQAKLREEEKVRALRVNTDMTGGVGVQESSISPTAVDQLVSASISPTNRVKVGDAQQHATTVIVGDGKKKQEQQPVASVNLAGNPSRVVKVDASNVIADVTADATVVVTKGTVAERIKALNAKKQTYSK
jgi:hypothetical protein